MTSPTQIRVLLADNHRVVRESLSRVLTDEGFDVVAEARTGVESVELSVQIAPAVVVVDLAMPDLGGVELVRELFTSAPTAKVLVLSGRESADETVAVIQAGASGYLQKTCSVRELVDAIRETVNEGASFGKSSASDLLKAWASGPATVDLASILTQQETTILQMIADGVSTPELAAELYISPRTVKNHLTSAYRKLEVNDRTQAVLKAARIGAVKLPT